MSNNILLIQNYRRFASCLFIKTHRLHHSAIISEIHLKQDTKERLIEFTEGLLLEPYPSLGLFD